MATWTNIEVELIVADYFDMLSKELAGRNYTKAEHRRKLLPQLNAFSNFASVNFIIWVQFLPSRKWLSTFLESFSKFLIRLLLLVNIHTPNL